MRFYQNKESGEIIGIVNMRQVIMPLTETAKKLGYTQFHYMVIYDVIAPNKLLGNGIVSFCIPCSLLKEHYKRINKKIAFTKHPKFIQYRHEHLPKVAHEERIKILHEQKF